MSIFKIVIAVFIGFLPFNWMRVLAYRFLLRYVIKGAKIGFGTIVAVSSAKIGRCMIGRFNQFIGPMSITIADSVRIGDLNKFICGSWVLHHGEEYARRLELNERSLITSSHYFDVCGSFRLGSSSWIAGIGSQFWTHGAVPTRYINIGNDCYIGSAVRFAPGASIENVVLVALGSVVSKEFKGDRLLIGGVPAAVIRRNYNWKAHQE